MKKLIAPLGLLLAAQLILVLFLYGSNGNSDADDTTTLLSFDREKVDAIDIIDGKEAPVKLIKIEGEWTVSSYFDLPAKNDKVLNILEKLREMDTPWPIATTKTAAKRFEVEDETFQRKIIFYQQGKVVDSLLLGSSPGFKKVHARIQGNDDIFAIPFSNYELGNGPQDWFDKTLLQPTISYISNIQFSDFTLTKEPGSADDNWSLSDLKAGETLNSEAINNFVKQLSQITVTSALDNAEETKTNGDTQVNPASDIGTITLLGKAEDDTMILSIKQDKDDNDYLLKSSNLAPYFRFNKAQADTLLKVKRDDLVIKPTPIAPQENSIEEGEQEAEQSKGSQQQPMGEKTYTETQLPKLPISKPESSAPTGE